MSAREAGAGSADPRDAAARWAARRQLGLMSEREEARFVRWLADPAHAEAWREVQLPLETAGDLAAFPSVQAMREAALAMQPDRRAIGARWIGWGMIAACLAAALLWAPALVPGGPAPPQVAAAGILREATRFGERREVPLPDGSRIVLNTASVVEIAYGPREREIRLVDGQALFRVARDGHRPFVVTAGDRRIVATGTEFDVRLDDQGTATVTLIEGHVNVMPVKPEGLARLFPAMTRESLAPGQQLKVSPAGDVRVVAADIERATSWTEGQLVFRDDPLTQAVGELNRYSAVRLVIEDPRVAELRVSGVFGTGRSENFVAALTSYYPVEAVRRSPGVISLRWRKARGRDD